MVKIPRVGTPGPAAHLNARLFAYVLKLTVALIPIQRIAPRVSAVQGADIFRVPLVKNLLLRNSLAGGGPHVGDVDVLIPVVVEVEPACAHAGARVLNAGFAGDGGEGSVPVVAV